MKNSKNYYIAGTILCLIAASFLVSIFTHPELTFSWPSWVSYVLFALYTIYTVIIFCMPKYKDASIGVCVILAMLFIAFVLIMISIGRQFSIGEANWYLPAGLFLTVAANFANLYRVRKNKSEDQKNKAGVAMEKMNTKVHQIKIDFNVTEQIKRFVYVYVIEARYCYLIDSGVYGCEKQIIEYLKGIGREFTDVKGIFLTHAHPDHIGSAAWFQKNTGCNVFASEGERRWIEDIDLQFKERPIPNFYKLAGKSCKVDRIIKDGDVISPEAGLEIKVIGTPGHSADEVSYLVGDALFIGDAVPVKGDIPILVNEQASRYTLERIAALPDIEAYYPAWDHTYSNGEMAEKLASAKELLNMLKTAVIEIDEGMKLPDLVDCVCERLKMPMLKMNPLFATTIQSLRKEQL